MDNELPKIKIDERTGIECHLEGDYYIPNLVMSKQEKIILNKYGRMRLNYLKKHTKADYKRNSKYSFERNTRSCSNESRTDNWSTKRKNRFDRRYKKYRCALLDRNNE